MNVVVGVASKLQLTTVHARPKLDTLGLTVVLYDAGTLINVLGSPYVQNFTVNKHPKLGTYACVSDTIVFAMMYCAVVLIVEFLAFTAYDDALVGSFVVLPSNNPTGFDVVMMYATCDDPCEFRLDKYAFR